MRSADTVREMARHLRAAEALDARGETALARGALDVAVVAALRLAATPAGTPGEHVTRVVALRDAVARLGDPLRRVHVAALIEAALAAEAMHRLGAGLPPHDRRLGGWMDGVGEPERVGAMTSPGVGALAPGDLDRYGAAVSGVDVDVALERCIAALRDVIALRTAGRDTGEAWAAFEAAAFGICTAPAVSRAARLDARRTLLIVWPAMRHQRPLAAAVLRKQLMIDRARWPCPVR